MRIRSFAMLMTIAMLWFLTVSCGDGLSSSTSGSGTADAGIDSTSSAQAQIDSFCDEVLPPMCEALFACCTYKTALSQALNAGATPQECVLRWKTSWCLHDRTGPLLKASLEGGHTILNHARLDACIAQLKAMSAGGDACVTPPAFYTVYNCFAAFEGQIAPGEACDWNIEDDSFMQCKNGRCEQGKCVPFLKTGDSCPTNQDPATSASKLCNFMLENEWCQGTGDEITGTCGPVRKVGEACGSRLLDAYGCMSHDCQLEQCAPMNQAFDACTIN